MNLEPWRQAVLTEAESWLRTPYRHRARVKGAGADCAQFLIGVYAAVGKVSPFEPEDYPQDWMMHRSEERYLGEVAQRCKSIPYPAPADIALFKFGRCFSHTGIVVSWPLLIHANLRDRCVAWGDATKGDLAGREVKFFEVL